MATRETMKATCKIVKPLMSTDYNEARRRVLRLYKDVYRFIPYIVRYFDIPKSEEQVRMKVRELFYKQACVTDLRIIDILVIKGYMELKELKNNWQQKGHVMANWKPTIEPRPYDFVGKFLAGID